MSKLGACWHCGKNVHNRCQSDEEAAVCPFSDKKPDPVNHPPHYTSHPSGVECIQITEWMNFSLGNAVKYIWRAGLKENDTPLTPFGEEKQVQDLEKAAWYLNREIGRLRKSLSSSPSSLGASPPEKSEKSLDEARTQSSEKLTSSEAPGTDQTRRNLTSHELARRAKGDIGEILVRAGRHSNIYSDERNYE